MFSRYFHDIEIAIESLLGNKLKSILTALGIIFGTAAVISMLAIGNGAQQEILEQIKNSRRPSLAPCLIYQIFFQPASLIIQWQFHKPLSYTPYQELIRRSYLHKPRKRGR